MTTLRCGVSWLCNRRSTSRIITRYCHSGFWRNDGENETVTGRSIADCVQIDCRSALNSSSSLSNCERRRKELKRVDD